jgi:hypothetical protein
MSARLGGMVAIVFGGLMVAACGSDGALLDSALPLPPDSVPLPRPAPRASAASIHSAAPVETKWRHVPEPVSAQQFNQDKAKCTNVANASPGSGSPEIKFYLAFTNCMQSQGYQISL